MRRTGAAPIVALPLAALMAACAPPPAPPAGAQQDSRPRVLATFTVLADMAENVACGRLRVDSITRTGAEIHGYEFTPSDLRRARGARLVLENGLGLEQWTRRFTARLGPVPTVTLSEGVATVPILSEGAGRGSHGATGASLPPNPHAWMSPQAARIYVGHIRDAFVRLDPAGAPTYRRCAAAYDARLRALDAELQGRLARLPPHQRLLVTCEGAFGYLARDYGLEEAWLWPVNGEREVTPRRMGRMIRKVRQRRVPAVFCESTVDDRIQRRVAAETGARFAGTFHVDSLSTAAGPAPTYLRLMRHNVDTLLAGLAPAGDPAAAADPVPAGAPATRTP